MDKAKELALSPAAAMKCVQSTPSGRFTLYVKGKFIKPPDFTQAKADSLVQIAQTEKGSSEVSCVIDQDNQGFLKAPTSWVRSQDRITFRARKHSSSERTQNSKQTIGGKPPRLATNSPPSISQSSSPINPARCRRSPNKNRKKRA